MWLQFVLLSFFALGLLVVNAGGDGGVWLSFQITWWVIGGLAFLAYLVTRSRRPI